MARVFQGRYYFSTFTQSSSLWKGLASNCMMHQRQGGFRFVSSKVDMKHLAQLRRMTGYSLSLCREALAETNNDIDDASKWLNEQAMVRGLQKAEKLQERKASEGLIGILVEDNHAAMVEIRCETDFVSQNEFFQHLVAKAATTALDHRKKIVQRGLDLGGSCTDFREVLLTHKLNDMKVPNSNETINEAVLQIVGRLGERIALQRAVTMTTKTSSLLGCYTHGPFTFNVQGCSMGKYGALVAVEPNSTSGNENLPALAPRLAQHIVGMSPSLISLEEAGSEKVDKNEILLEQQYLMDDTITVRDLLTKNDANVVDFIRLVCGEE